MTSTNYNNFSLPITSYFYNVEDFEKDLAPVALISSPIQAGLIKNSSARLLKAIDPALISQDRADGSTNNFYRLVCNIYYAARKFFVSSKFLNTVLDLHTQSDAFLTNYRNQLAAAAPAPLPPPTGVPAAPIRYVSGTGYSKPIVAA